MAKIPHLAQLTESILESGPLLPVYLLGGECIDGARRLQICLEQGIDHEVVQLSNEREAAALLWGLHPDRAVARFDDGQRSLLTLAEWFGCRVSEILAVRKSRAPKKDPPPPRAETKKQIHVRLNADARAILYEMRERLQCTVPELMGALLVSADLDVVRAQVSSERKERADARRKIAESKKAMGENHSAIAERLPWARRKQGPASAKRRRGRPTREAGVQF